MKESLEIMDKLEENDFIVYSYVMTHSIYLAAISELTFEKCVDTKLLESPDTYC
jgi:hypothetical protein